MATRTLIPDEVYDRHFPTAAGHIIEALAMTPAGEKLINDTIRRMADEPREDHHDFVADRVGELVRSA